MPGRTYGVLIVWATFRWIRLSRFLSAEFLKIVTAEVTLGTQPGAEDVRSSDLTMESI